PWSRIDSSSWCACALAVSHTARARGLVRISPARSRPRARSWLRRRPAVGAGRSESRVFSTSVFRNNSQKANLPPAPRRPPPPTNAGLVDRQPDGLRISWFSHQPTLPTSEHSKPSTSNRAPSPRPPGDRTAIQRLSALRSRGASMSSRRVGIAMRIHRPRQYREKTDPLLATSRSITPLFAQPSFPGGTGIVRAGCRGRIARGEQQLRRECRLGDEADVAFGGGRRRSMGLPSPKSALLRSFVPASVDRSLHSGPFGRSGRSFHRGPFAITWRTSACRGWGPNPVSTQVAPAL